MSTALLARSALRAPAMRRQLVQTRGIHIENTVGNNMPFTYTKSKSGIAFKVFALMAGGFALPFVAAKWQIYKASA